MTQLEDLLRTALNDAPAPHASMTDPLADLDRRIGRARLRIGGVAMAAVAILVAAIVVPISLTNGHGSPKSRSQPAAEIPITRWRGNVSSVTAGGGYVWTMSQRARARRSIELLQRRDPTTGRVLGKTALPAPLEFATYGLGELWVWGGGDGGYPNGRVAEVSPDLQVRRNVSLGYGKGIATLGSSTGQAFAFWEAKAYAIRENGGVLDTFLKGRSLSARSKQTTIPGSVRLVATRRTLYVVGRHGVVRAITLASRGIGGPRLQAPSLASLGVPLAAAPDGLWTWRDGRLVRINRDGVEMGTPIRLQTVPTAAVFDPLRGLYVAMDPPGSSAADLMYFSLDALRSNDPLPTAMHHGGGIDNLALDPAGGVVVLGGHLSRWAPTPTG